MEYMQREKFICGGLISVSEANILKKGIDPLWSEEVYTVEVVQGMSITPKDDKVYMRDKKIITSKKIQLKAPIQLKPNKTLICKTAT